MPFRNIAPLKQALWEHLQKTYPYIYSQYPLFDHGLKSELTITKFADTNFPTK